jgi:hypothetical protein
MALNDSFGNLVNDITQQVLQQVQEQVRVSIADTVAQRIAELITADRINTIITTEVQQQVARFQPDLSGLDARIIEAGDAIIRRIDEDYTARVGTVVDQKISRIDLEPLVKTAITDVLNTQGQHLSLAPSCIPASALDLNSLRITGDNISGGVVANFASTGIDDRATQCQLTIMDAGTVFENTLYAAQIEVRGNAVIDGDLIIKGSIPRNSQTYQNILEDVNSISSATQDRILNYLQTQTLDVAQLTIDNRVVIEGNTLTTAVLNSRLQSVGVLRDLQTAGETLLSETLYTTNRRVGINTMDPSTALSIWDEEIELGVGKVSLNTAQFGTRRDHDLILSSNGKNNVTLKSDGTTEIAQLRLGNMQFLTRPSPPADNLPKGTVVFNENPSLGGPLGWVSLGDARWANFGIID